VKARGRIVVAGTFAGVSDQAGATWAVMQYVLGFRGLGYDVWVVEPVANPGKATDASFARTARSFALTVAEFGLADRAALLLGNGRCTVGATRAAIRRACADADLLLNISGVLTDHDLLERCSSRLYLDLDPAFNQMWHAGGLDRGFASHTHHFTVGAAIGAPPCAVPTCGVRWRTTVPPVVLDQWPAAPPAPAGAYTTVANWRSYGSIDAGGVFHGQKAHSVRDLIELPKRAPERIELALAIHRDEHQDLRMLERNGWRIVNASAVAGGTSAYRDFISSSKAEIGIAKAGYVTSRCGWFSDRSACYLAAGRPVVAQDTGFGRRLPVGEGLLSFISLDSAVAAIESVALDYAGHARSARQLAEAHLDSRLVLQQMIEEVASG
jgi:hypothetical protein